MSDNLFSLGSCGFLLLEETGGEKIIFKIAGLCDSNKRSSVLGE